MAHLGILCPVSDSHLNNMFTLGRELQNRGHQLTLFSLLDAQSRALAEGLDFHSIGEQEFPAGGAVESIARLGELSGLEALRYTVRLCKVLTTINLREASTAIKALNVDFLLIDQGILEGGTIAEFLSIPFITVCSAVVLNQEPSVPPYITPWSYESTWWAHLRNRVGYGLLNRLTKPIRELIADYRQEWKLPVQKHPDDVYSRLAQLSQQPIDFEFPRQQLPKCFHFTGPYQNQASRKPISFPFERLTGQPLIYASLGTVQNRLLRVFRQIAEACLGLDAQLVISLGGGASPDSLSHLPGNPLVVDYAPQLELLKRAALTITHAGMNTTLESLSNAVPMVAIPITNDQPGIAARIAWTGTGEVIPLKRLRVPRLRKAIERVLSNDAYRHNALKLQAAIDQAGGVRRAADIIEQAISTGEPVIA